jgi:hypothetical protein
MITTLRDVLKSLITEVEHNLRVRKMVPKLKEDKIKEKIKNN